MADFTRHPTETLAAMAQTTTTTRPGSIPARVLPTREAAVYCGSSESTFEKKRLDGTGPPFIRITARRVGYLVDDLDRWLDAKARLTRSCQAVQR
jgi:predicted DNA-binding transcriptional regulator AlpA